MWREEGGQVGDKEGIGKAVVYDRGRTQPHRLEPIGCRQNQRYRYRFPRWDGSLPINSPVRHRHLTTAAHKRVRDGVQRQGEKERSTDGRSG